MGNNVIIDFGGGNTLTLANYNLIHLNASAIQFGGTTTLLAGDNFDFGASADSSITELELDITSLSDAESQSLLALAEVDPEYAQLLQGLWEDSASTEDAAFGDLVDSLI